MRLMRRIAASLGLTLALAAALPASAQALMPGDWFVSSSSSAGEWVWGSRGWWYRTWQGGYFTNAWMRIGGNLYHFDSAGWMDTGWLKYKDNWYWLGSDGALATGWRWIGGRWYYFRSESYQLGVMATGPLYVNGKQYFFEYSGALPHGAGWHQEREAMGQWYYVGADGVCARGWRSLGGKWYYFGDNGGAVFWSVNDGRAAYAFNPDGSWHTTPGWYKAGSINFTRWVYVNPDGTCVRGWKKIGGTWYFFENDGEMVECGTVIWKGKVYAFNLGGSWRTTPGWFDADHQRCYVQADGTCLTGSHYVDGRMRTFDQYGALQ